MTISPAQVRAARALLDLTGPELAEAAGLSLPTVRRYENGGTGSKLANAAFQRAFEAAGIEFLENDGLRRVAVKAKKRR